jgi:hypothetical protein
MTSKDIDFKRIRQDKVKKFILRFGLLNTLGFKRIKAVCHNPLEDKTYRRHHRSYLINNDIATVWQIYKTIHPKDAWNGEMVSFGVQYSKNNECINYLNDHYSGMEIGQIIILNLRLLWGLLNIAVAHEVADINDEERMIKLCYMEGSASEGSQWIQLTATKEGFTEVSHLTLYKSKSALRDTQLYPRLHTKAITEFHENVKKTAELLKK